MHEWFAQYMQAQLEDYLPDPYEEICGKLRSEEPFSFSRFGDGEFAAIFGVEGANVDGHSFYPDLGARLRDVVERKPDYMMGLQTQALLAHGALPIRALSPGIDWVLADSLHNASMEGCLGSFFDAIQRRKAALVGPQHLYEFSEAKGWAHISVPSKNCWEQYDSILERLQEEVSGAGLVVLFAASMMSNVLIDDMYASWPANTYLDVGSVLDPYAGVCSRAYHKELNSDPLRGIDHCP